MYKIEALVNGDWTDDAVGTDNEFETEDSAEEMIPELAQIFDSPQNEFRVVEK